MTGKKTGLKVAKKNNRAGFLFLLPLIVIFIGLLGYSFYFLISNSFRDVTITILQIRICWFSKLQTIFKDKSFWKSLLNTFILSTANIFCGLTFGFIIAIILNFKIKGKRFFHALFFIPSMLPIALMATVFGSMLEYKNGIVNQILRGVGLGALAQRWLGRSETGNGSCVFRFHFHDRYPDHVLYGGSDNDQQKYSGSSNNRWSRNERPAVTDHFSGSEKYT